MIAIDTKSNVFYVIDAEGTLVVTKDSLEDVLKSFYEECKLDTYNSDSPKEIGKIKGEIKGEIDFANRNFTFDGVNGMNIS